MPDRLIFQIHHRDAMVQDQGGSVAGKGQDHMDSAKILLVIKGRIIHGGLDHGGGDGGEYTAGLAGEDDGVLISVDGEIAGTVRG